MNSDNKQLNVLFIEDNKEDAFLTVRYLKQFWTEVNYLVVDSLDKLNTAFKLQWDVILCDFSLPGFDGMTALRLTKESGVKTPFIVLSGEVSDEIAMLMIRLGANDYIKKDDMKRLAPVILRLITQSKIPVEINTQNSEIKNEKQKTSKSSSKIFYPVGPGENEVLENNPITERHKAVINMLFVTEFIRRHQAAVLEKQNLTIQRLNILRTLKRVFPGKISIKDIKQEIIYKTIDLSRMIEKMKQEGLVDSVTSKTDHRAKDIMITKRGLEVLDTADKHDDEMFLPENYLSEENAAKINEALQETLRMVK